MSRTWTIEEKIRASEEILSAVAKGSSLIAVCSKPDDWIPAEGTFRGWCDADPDLAARYARAREVRADVIFEECLNIADSKEGDLIVVDGVEMQNHDFTSRAKLRIETRKWFLSKLAPKSYGDKLAIDHESPNGTMTPDRASENLKAKIDAIASRTAGQPDQS